MPESLAGMLFVASLALALVVVHRPLGDLLFWIAISQRTTHWRPFQGCLRRSERRWRCFSPPRKEGVKIRPAAVKKSLRQASSADGGGLLGPESILCFP